MEKVEVVTFDISDQSFDYYTLEGWKQEVRSYRAELAEDMEPEYLDSLTDDEVIEAMYGGELFYDII